MEIIRFMKDHDKTYNGNINIFGNILSILFDGEAPEQDVLLGGFELLNEHNGRIQGKYTDYNTLYRSYDDNAKLFELSNDQSVYVPYVPVVELPTQEELQAIFERNKLNKIAASKAMLESYLEANPLRSTCHGGAEGKYNITSEKQTLMSNNYLTYMIGKQTGNPVELTWNETGKECEIWTEEEFLQLIMEVQAFVKPLVSLQQKYEVRIRDCHTQEELDAVALTYNLTE